MILTVCVRDFDMKYLDDIKECIIHNSSNRYFDRIIVFSDKDLGLSSGSRKISTMKMDATHFEAISYSLKQARRYVVYSNPLIKFTDMGRTMDAIDRDGTIARCADSYYIFGKNTKIRNRSCIDDILVGNFVEASLHSEKKGYYSIPGFPVASAGWKISKRIDMSEAAAEAEEARLRAASRSDQQAPADIVKIASRERKLDVVIVSVDYNDVLDITLERNSKIFESIVVVTSNSDSECDRICRKHGVKVVKTDCMYSGGASFNKGKAINLGMASIENPDVVLLLDADVIVEDMPDLSSINENIIYYRDRIMLRDYAAFERYESGERSLETQSIGPVGYFQLFSYKGQKYPESSHDAAWSDVKFARRFRHKRRIETPVLHLGEDGKNWKGRVTESFEKKSEIEIQAAVPIHEDIREFEINSYFDNIYCINLDNRKDRWEKAAKNMEIAGICAERFSGIEGASLDFVPKIEDEEASSMAGNIENSAALGCLLTHLKVVKDAKSKGYKKILILEDDVLFSKDFAKEAAAAAEKDWKMLYLGASQFDWSGISPEDGFYRCKNTLGTFAYALDCSIYDNVIKEFERMDRSADNALASVQKRIEGCYVFFPNIAISDVSDSDIRKEKDMKEYSKSMRWNLDRFISSSFAEVHYSSTEPKRILLVPDVRGWAFDNIAKSIVKYNPCPDLIRYDIVYVSELKESPNLDCYDYAYVFFEAERIIPDGPKIIRGCYSAFWMEDKRFTPEIFGKIFSSCRGVVFVNENLRDSISKYLPNDFPITTIHDSADESKFYPVDGLKEDAFKVIFVGNTKRKVKRFKEILDICDRAGVELIVCKDVKNDELVEYYNRADICINFSDSEGGPQTFIESSLCGVPMLIKSGNSLSKKIPCFTGETQQDFIDILNRLKTESGRRECVSVGESARLVAMEYFTYSRTAAKFAQFFLEIDSPIKKNDLSEHLTVFIIRFGENPNYDSCREALEKQTVSFKIEEIRDVAPMSLAFQNMIDRCETEYYIQVDEDMILENESIDKIYKSLVESAENISTVVHMLRDVHLDFNIFGIKGYKHYIMKQYPYNLDIISCEMEQISRLQKDGYETMMVGEVVGLHSPEWTEELIFERYFDLMEKWKNFKYHWMEELPAKLMQIFRENPSNLNLYALMGAMSSISSGKTIRNREKNFLIKDDNFERISGMISIDEFQHIRNFESKGSEVLSKQWFKK